MRSNIARRTATGLLLMAATSTVTLAQSRSAESDGWYDFKPTSTPAEGVIGMQDWLAKPAGKNGRVTIEGDQLTISGQPVKFWGLNNCYSACAPDKEEAERKAKFYAKYGVNAVRLHKYADGPGWAGIQSKKSFVEFDKAGLDRMDYFIAQMKENGIYTKLSPTFGVKPGPDDRKAVPYLNEFGELIGGDEARVGTGHGSIFLSHELQDLQIQQMVNLLKHRNPYTRQTYAEDPAIMVLELFNEDSALFYGTMTQLQKVPTLRKRASAQFTQWLKAKYGTKEKLLAAWGEGALNSFQNEKLLDESWEDATIVPTGNPWFYDPTQLEGSQAPKKARLLDTMQFLYDIQNEFYDRYVKAIRETGYEGAILGSNWQAGRAFSHFYNLHSDARVGIVDRHNYFGGGDSKNFDNASMLQNPGGEMLSTGMQQVVDRPFMLSEWIHVKPNEWGVEGPAIIGAYGMGLNGWDVSFMFQNRDNGRFTENIGRDQWDVTAPQVFGIFPAVARQVLRGDVKESDLVIARNVHVPSLAQGKLGFEDAASQQGDVKTFGDISSAATLAVGRAVVAFTEQFEETPAFDLEKYRQDGALVSATGQLKWWPGQSKTDGHFTINTPGTQAVVGFAQDQTFELADVRIEPHSRFAAIYLTARGRDQTIADAKDVIVTAIARARNSGMSFNDAENAVQDAGKPPVRLEAVKATISLKRGATATVELLDHDGAPTGKRIEVKDGKFEIDGARDKTPYYVIRY